MKFTFDVTLLATFEVESSDEATARALLKGKLDGTSANFGAWPDGSPIVTEVGVEGNLELQDVQS